MFTPDYSIVKHLWKSIFYVIYLIKWHKTFLEVKVLVNCLQKIRKKSRFDIEIDELARQLKNLL